MGGLIGAPFESYDPYDPGSNDRIFALDPMEPEPRVGQRPGQEPPPGALLGLLALTLGYWAKRQSSAPNAPATAGAPIALGAEGRERITSDKQRRLSDRTDPINGGPGRIPQTGLANVNRAARLAGLPGEGFDLGQRTQFPPVVAGADNVDLPAVLRGVSIGQRENAGPWQARINKRAVDRQEITPFHIPDDLDIPDFLRRTTEVKDNKAPQQEEYRPKIIGDGLGGGGGGGSGGGGDSGNDGNDDGCKDEIRKMRKICIDAYADGWNGNYTAWRSNYRVGPYKKNSGGRWTIQDCMKGLVSKRCGGENPDDEENKKKYARPPRPRRPPR